MSETTHLICAHCGGDNPLSNASIPESLNGRVPAMYYIVLPERVSIFFHCQLCDADYRLTAYNRGEVRTEG